TEVDDDGAAGAETGIGHAPGIVSGQRRLVQSFAPGHDEAVLLDDQVPNLGFHGAEGSQGQTAIAERVVQTAVRLVAGDAEISLGTVIEDAAGDDFSVVLQFDGNRVVVPPAARAEDLPQMTEGGVEGAVGIVAKQG